MQTTNYIDSTGSIDKRCRNLVVGVCMSVVDCVCCFGGFAKSHVVLCAARRIQVSFAQEPPSMRKQQKRYYWKLRSLRSEESSSPTDNTPINQLEKFVPNATVNHQGIIRPERTTTSCFHWVHKSD
jgi:hypothetical protein